MDDKYAMFWITVFLTIPLIASADTIFLMKQDMLFVYDPVAQSVDPYMGAEYGGVVGVDFDELASAPNGVLYGIKKKQGGVGFWIYSVGVPTSAIVCDYSAGDAMIGNIRVASGDLRFTYGIDSNMELWYASGDKMDYTINIAQCFVTARGLLIRDACTSGALHGNQAPQGGTLNMRYCASNDGSVFDVATNTTVGSISLNGAVPNFGLDLFVYCPTYGGLYLFYETTPGGLIFDNAVPGIQGVRNISFGLGDSSMKWAASSVGWC